MRIPHVIYFNTYTAYDSTKILVQNVNKKFIPDAFKWDDGFIKELRELCLISIANTWEKYPFYSELQIPRDKSELLEILSTDLPLEITVPIIDEDYYWERCYCARWPNAPPPNKKYKYEKIVKIFSRESSVCSTEKIISEADLSEMLPIQSLSELMGDGSASSISVNSIPEIKTDFTTISVLPNLIMKTWKQCFLERFVAESLERMVPDVYNPEFITELSELYGDYIISLKINQLQPSKSEDRCEHISLFTLLSTMPNMIEFSVCFGKANLVDNFTWHDLKVSENDCELLGKGVAKSNLEILRVHRSDVDCLKVKLLVRSLETHPTLRVLDFSNCKISDDGALAIAAVLMKNPTIDTLTLINNKIGERGAQGLAYYLCQEESRLIKLNLKLNPLYVQGGGYIATALARGAKSLRYLSLAACGLNDGNFPFGMALGLNSTLQNLDLSNNLLGENSGNILLERLQNNSSLIRLDLRFCDIPEDIVQQIHQIIDANFRNHRRDPLKTAPYTVDIV